MKIGCVYAGGIGDLYGEKYDESFWHELWKNNLVDKLSENDELVWLSYDDIKDLDKDAKDYEALIGIWITDNMINEKVLTDHPKLKYISTLSHGFGKIDKEAVHKHGVTVTNTVYGDVTIAEFAFALLMDICHDIGRNDEYYRYEKWKPENKDKRRMNVTPQLELYGKTFGVLGLGNIGYCAAKIANGFGMKVLGYSRHKKNGEKYNFIEQVDLEDLLKRSDVISIHCPLTDETKNLLNKEAFDKMKDGVIIINTARGAIIDEEALKAALDSGKVYAAGLDVLAGEPLSEPSELMKCKNTRITEHIAWLPVESRIRSVKIACDNFLNWRAGNPTSVVV